MADTATAPAPQQPKTKKALWKKWWFWVIAVLVLGAIGNGMGKGGSTTTPDAVSTGTVSTPAAGTPAANSAPAANAPAAKKWVKVIALSGKANKRSAPFELTSDSVRLKYTVKGKTSPIFGVYVPEQGTNIQKDGGIPEVMVTEAGGDTTFLTKAPGKYFLDVTSANAAWSVVIEEER